MRPLFILVLHFIFHRIPKCHSHYAEELPVPLSEIKQGMTNFSFTYELDPCEQHLGAAEMYKHFRGVGFHFYHRTNIRSVMHNDSKEYYRDDEWSCEDTVTKLQQEGIIPDDLNFDPGVWRQSNHAEYTCQTRTPLGCNECPTGFQHHQDRITGGSDDDGDGLTLTCRPRPITPQSLRTYFVRHYRQARQLTGVVSQYCPSAHFRDAFGFCSGTCPANCLYCRYPGEKCQRCARGYTPTYNNRECLPPELECPSGLYTLVEGERCQRCPAGCKRCQKFTGRCQECQAGRLLVINRFKRACVLLCPKGTYLDDDTKRCVDCPPWCKQCDGKGCLECADGLYSTLFHRNLTSYQACYSVCPHGTYAHNTNPFHCRVCHPTCFGCYGETNKHCLACRTYARIETESKSAFCDISAIDSAVDAAKFVAGFYVVIRFPKYGVPMPGGTWINLTEARGWSGRAFSISFRKRMEWDEYFEGRQRDSNWSVVDVWKPFCRSPDCLENCEPGHSIYHPCRKCKPGAFKDLDGYCVKECKNGSFPDAKLGLCVPCSQPARCKRCGWKPLTDPHYLAKGYKTYADMAEFPYIYPKLDELDPNYDSGDRQICYEYYHEQRHCDLDSHFLDGNNTCIPCHPECKGGCTGIGSRSCKACRFAVDLHGYCIQRCRSRSDMEETMPGWNTCVYRGNYMRPTRAISFNKRFPWNIWHKLTLLLLFPYIMIQGTLAGASWYLGEASPTPLLNWRDESKIQEQAMADLALARRLRSRGSSRRHTTTESAGRTIVEPSASLPNMSSSHSFGADSYHRNPLLRTRGQIYVRQNPFKRLRNRTHTEATMATRAENTASLRSDSTRDRSATLGTLESITCTMSKEATTGSKSASLRLTSTTLSPRNTESNSGRPEAEAIDKLTQ